MQPITYLCFTLLSIVIQFCLMDFINQRVQNETFLDHNSSATKESRVLEKKNEKPLALFYRTERKNVQQNVVEQEHYSNSTLRLHSFATSTDYTSTIYDLFYDENSSTTDHTIGTEASVTNTEWDNVTEITFFDKKSTSSAKPSEMPKKINKTDNCHCDLLNCTTLHCTHWTVLVCDNRACVNYNQVLHEPSCSDTYCNNVGTKVEYKLYCNGSIITKAVIKFHVRQVSVTHQFVSQEIVVNYYMGNETIDETIKYSGNPGYMKGYEVIASFAGNNHSKFFYNRTHGNRRYLFLPYNENGLCLSTNFTYSRLIFGQNKRIICRLRFTQKILKHNKTDVCLKIQERIIELLQLNDPIFISPRGNPSDVSDDEWVALEKFNKSDIYGQYRSNDSNFLCYNLITRFAFIFIFGDESMDFTEQYKILSARVEGTARNITFNTDSLSVVVTVDTSFIDASAPAALEYGGAPHLDIHLPKNFFFPSQSTACKHTLTKLLYLSAIVFLNK